MLSKELLGYYRHVSQQMLTVVDVETTGRFANCDRMMEVSVLQATLTDGIQQQQTYLINPQIPIPDRIVRFTGITPAMVAMAPVAADVLPALLLPLSQGVLTAHNLEFDYSFLQTEFDRLGIAFSRPVDQQLCTVQLSRLMLPQLRSRSLPDLVQHFQFDVGRSHRAAADTLACWLLAKHLLTEILNEDDEVLLARFAYQRMPLKYAAELLGCSLAEAQEQLKAAQVPAKFVGWGKKGTWIYRRGDVERVFYEQQGISPSWC